MMMMGNMSDTHIEESGLVGYVLVRGAGVQVRAELLGQSSYIVQLSQSQEITCQSEGGSVCMWGWSLVSLSMMEVST